MSFPQRGLFCESVATFLQKKSGVIAPDLYFKKSILLISIACETAQ